MALLSGWLFPLPNVDLSFAFRLVEGKNISAGRVFACFAFLNEVLYYLFIHEQKLFSFFLSNQMNFRDLHKAFAPCSGHCVGFWVVSGEAIIRELKQGT